MRSTVAALLLALVFLFAPQAARAECPHPFMPLKAGATWTYRLTATRSGHDMILRTRIESVHKDGDADVAELATEMFPLASDGSEQPATTSVKQELRCDAQGLHTAPSVPATQPEAGPAEAGERVLSQSGVTLPSSDALRRGASWIEGSTVEMSIASPAGPRAVRVQRDPKLRLAGTEKLTVAAGTFDALKVLSDEDVRVSQDGPLTSVRTELWYAKGVGMIRKKTPQGTVELVKFTPGA